MGVKKGMSQTFIGGVRYPVTKVNAGPCVITQVKNEEKDGYWAVQIGFGNKKLTKISKPLRGHLKKSAKGDHAPRFLREVRLNVKPELGVGDELKVSDIFKEGDYISVAGVSKGKGFAGVIKRWGFAGGPRTHGQSDRERAPGSIGQGTTPGRVRKGKKMAGRMGGDKVTVKNLRVISVDGENHTLTVSGSVPGAPNSLLVIRKLSGGTLNTGEPSKVKKVKDKVAKRGDTKIVKDEKEEKKEDKE